MDQPELLAKEVLLLLANSDSRTRFGRAARRRCFALRPTINIGRDDVTN